MMDHSDAASAGRPLRVDRIDIGAGPARDVADWVEVRNAASAELFGDDAQRTSVEIVRAMAARPDQTRECYLARDADGTAVGTAALIIQAGSGGSEAEVWLSVDPRRRRAGTGAAMVRALEQRAVELGCARLVLDQASPREDGSPGAGFATAMGYRVTRRVLGCRLSLPLSESLIGPLEAQAREAIEPAYEVLTAWDTLPEDWLDDRAVLAQGLSTQTPAGGIDHGGEDWDAERVRTMWMSRLAGGGRAVESVAVERETGRLVAFSDLVVYSSMPSVATQSDTLVLEEHRGHRLGLAVKIANLRMLAAELPDVSAIKTWTAEDNLPMLEMNRSLGFEVVEWTRMWARDL